MKQSAEWIPGTKTVAFLGSSAAGKSSVINSLLDFPDIVSTVRNLELSGKHFILIKGNRGILAQPNTTVVTEYMQKDLGQAQSIKVEVEYRIIGRLLCSEPSARASARQVPGKSWFKEYLAHCTQSMIVREELSSN